ncbi:MAG: hypothetical protein JW750_13075 [Anaerolineaceae bacterium]|nr:hypothetical protein [Anaerolineaceae bacterium]
MFKRLSRFIRSHENQIAIGFGAILIAAFAWFIINRAWLSDDAYITFRVIDNWFHGYGLRWNVVERVQVFTHPLWMLLISGIHFFTGEFYLTSIFVGTALSLFTAVLLFLLPSGKYWPRVLGLMILASSSAMVDYSTSGLENSLSNALLMLFILLWIRDPSGRSKFRWLCLIVGVSTLNRLDLAILYFPMLGYLVFQQKNLRQALYDLLIGFSPVIAWELFALIYYGFPFPNTMYAKLSNWIPQADLYYQGWRYFHHTFFNDPVTGMTFVLGVVMAFIHRSSQRTMMTLGAGCYLFYIIWVGGDFMEGRFFTVIFILMLAGIVHYDLPSVRLKQYAWLAPAVIILNLYSSVPTFVSESWDFVEPWTDGIVNERYFYAPTTGLLRFNLFNTGPEHNWVDEGLDLREQACDDLLVVDFTSVGFRGYYAGPNVYIIDRYGLGTAVTGHLPPRNMVEWRIGHFIRTVPDGYYQTIEQGTNQFSDPALRSFYDDLRLVTEAPLFTKGRLKAIWKLNTTRLSEMVDEHAYRFPNKITLKADEWYSVKPNLTPCQAGNVLSSGESGVEIRFDERQKSSSYQISLCGYRYFRIDYYNQHHELAGTHVIHLPSTNRLQAYRIHVPDEVVEQGFDSVHIYPFYVMGKRNRPGNFGFGFIQMSTDTLHQSPHDAGMITRQGYFP